MGIAHAVKFFSDVQERFWIKKGAAPYVGSLNLGQVWEGTDNQTRVVLRKVPNPRGGFLEVNRASYSVSLPVQSYPAAAYPRNARWRTSWSGSILAMPAIGPSRPSSETGLRSPSSRPVTRHRSCHSFLAKDEGKNSCTSICTAWHSQGAQCHNGSRRCLFLYQNP